MVWIEEIHCGVHGLRGFTVLCMEGIHCGKD